MGRRRRARNKRQLKCGFFGKGRKRLVVVALQHHWKEAAQNCKEISYKLTDPTKSITCKLFKLDVFDGQVHKSKEIDVTEEGFQYEVIPIDTSRRLEIAVNDREPWIVDLEPPSNTLHVTNITHIAAHTVVESRKGEFDVQRQDGTTTTMKQDKCSTVVIQHVAGKTKNVCMCNNGLDTEGESTTNRVDNGELSGNTAASRLHMQQRDSSESSQEPSWVVDVIAYLLFFVFTICFLNMINTSPGSIAQPHVAHVGDAVCVSFKIPNARKQIAVQVYKENSPEGPPIVIDTDRYCIVSLRASTFYSFGLSLVDSSGKHRTIKSIPILSKPKDVGHVELVRKDMYIYGSWPRLNYHTSYMVQPYKNGQPVGDPFLTQSAHFVYTCTEHSSLYHFEVWATYGGVIGSRFVTKELPTPPKTPNIRAEFKPTSGGFEMCMEMDRNGERMDGDMALFQLNVNGIAEGEREMPHNCYCHKPLMHSGSYSLDVWYRNKYGLEGNRSRTYEICTPPKEIEDLRVEREDMTLTVSWKDQNQQEGRNAMATTYLLEAYQDGMKISSWEQGDSSFSYTNLTYSSTVNFTVQAQNKCGLKSSTAVTPVVFMPPEPLRQMKVGHDGNGRTCLWWDPPAGKTVKRFVQLLDALGKPVGPSKELVGSDRFCPDFPAPSTPYFLDAWFVNAHGVQGVKTRSEKIFSPPKSLQYLTVTIDHFDINLTWLDPCGAYCRQTYHIQEFCYGNMYRRSEIYKTTAKQYQLKMPAGSEQCWVEICVVDKNGKKSVRKRSDTFLTPPGTVKSTTAVYDAEIKKIKCSWDWPASYSEALFRVTVFENNVDVGSFVTKQNEFIVYKYSPASMYYCDVSAVNANEVRGSKSRSNVAFTPPDPDVEADMNSRANSNEVQNELNPPKEPAGDQKRVPTIELDPPPIPKNSAGN